MKRNDFLILLAAMAHSWFFYNHDYGLNVLLFTLLLLCLLLFRDPKLLFRRQWLATAAGSLLSGTAVFLYGSDQALFLNYLSIFAVGAFSFQPESSLLIAVLHGFYSVASSFIRLPIDAIKNLQTPSDQPRSGAIKKMVLAAGPLAVAFLFFLVYYFSNELFQHQVDQIDWSFLNVGRLFCLVVAGVLLYGFFCQHIIQQLITADLENSDQLNKDLFDDQLNPFQHYWVAVPNQIYTGVLLFGLLNLLLLAVNATDLYYLFVVKKLPDGVNLSSYLHSGTNALIVSILMAIAVILFYFRGKLNFEAKNGWLRQMAFLWIAQNAMLVFTTAMRNAWYIADWGLTYKRIGVFIYLTLCIAGLITTAIKVAQARSNWFLFRKNSWMVYGLLSVCVIIDWDGIITSYNISRFEKDRTMEIDPAYLIHLGNSNLAQLYQFYVVEGKSLQSAAPYDRTDERMIPDQDGVKWSPRQLVVRKYDAARLAEERSSWQDFVWCRYHALREIAEHQLHK